MRPGDVEDLYELAPLQQGILFHSLAAQDPGLYLMAVSYALRGTVDVPLFLRAWQRVLERNPVLRTSFHWRDLDKPLQLVHRHVTLPSDVLDWRDQPRGGQERNLAALLESEGRREFQLDHAPLMRLRLVRTAAERYQLIWVFHHILMEGWSASLVLREVFTIYEGLRRGEPVEPAPRRPYRDHVLWLQERDIARAEWYWRRELRGFSAPTPLPLARSISAAAGAGGYGRHSLLLPPAPSAALSSLARRQRLTMGTLVLGAWALLLSRHSDEEDVLFGSVVSGRQEALPGAESMVGLFVNTVPTRVTVPPKARLLPWLESLQARLVQMREFEWSPLAQVQAWSDAGPGTPLFQTIFAFENWAGDMAPERAAGGLVVEAVRPAEGGTGYPLLVEAAAAGARVSVALSYSRRHYDEAGAAQLLGQLGRVLEGMAAHPEGVVGDLLLVDGAEHARRVASWNGTTTPMPPEDTVSGLFERQARETPGAPAVVDEGGRITYAELSRRSNGLAQHLRDLGVGPGSRVGICCERSLDLAVGLLGILKVGGAYVPLDPTHPPERLGLVLQDTEAQVVVTQQPLVDRLPPSDALRVVLDRDRGVNALQGVDAPADGPEGESLAYVIHTSGSTGRPKGVEVPHRAVVNFLLAMRHEPGLAGSDTLLSVTTASFDIFVLELFLPLTVGACVSLVSREVASDGRALAQALARSGATVMQATPATWRMLLEAGWTGNPRLKALCGGEAMPPELARRLLPLCGSLWNLYGPTETTVWSTAHRVTSVDGRVPIGRPIANTQIYVLDTAGRLAAPGEPGDLHIGGLGVARGYRNRGDLTADRFVPDPFGETLGSRLYRTGDRARWRPDGVLECLGREDHQVKVRGFRIEPAEIETALAAHPDIREAAVVARADGEGGRRLIAYVVGRSADPPATDELRAFLAGRLPEYMIPGTYLPLPSLPLTPSGKIDRGSLPTPDRSRPQLSRAFVAPRTPEEETVAAIWRELLQLETVGIHDGFFDLGGHSLLLLRAHDGLKKAFPRCDLAVVDLFRYTTLADIARHVGEGPDDVALTEESRQEAVGLRAGRARLGLRRGARAAAGTEGSGP